MTPIARASVELVFAARTRDRAQLAARRRIGKPEPSAEAIAALTRAIREWEVAYDALRTAKGLEPVWGHTSEEVQP